MSLDAKISMLCSSFFLNCEINYENVEDYILFKIYTNGNLCLIFKNIDNDTIKIERLMRCAYSGSDVLNNLELLALNLGQIRCLKLQDQSTVIWSDTSGIDDDIIIDFALLNIVSKNNSFYNSLGYYQDDYELERSQWNMVRNDNLYNYLEYIQTLDYDYYNNIKSNFYHDGLELFANEIYKIRIDEDNYYQILANATDFIVERFEKLYGIYNIKEVKNYQLATLVCSYIKNNIQIQFIDKIYHYLLISLFGLCIHYDRFELVKLI